MPIRTSPARITTAVRPARSRRWLTSGALIALTTGLGLLAPQGAVALAQSPRPATIGAGNAHSCTIESGKAYCWGENDYGQLGNGSTTDSSVPVPVDTRGVLAGKTLTQISAGGGGGVDTCALDRAGAAFCWGSNFDGALGDGKTAASFSSVPVAVDTRGVLAGQTLTQISAGSDGGCVLDRQGVAYCWGDNDYGELGNGRGVSSSVPVAVDTRGVLADQTLTQISAGYEDTCGLDSRGAAYCWGDNYYLELGDGSSRAYSSVPVAVSASGALAGRRLTQLSAGFWYECAVDTAGAAFCWGTGALGSATVSSSGVPVAVEASGVLAGRRLTQVSAGFGEACALARGGTAFCWGDNTSGELGNGSTVSSDVAVAVDTTGVLAGKTLAQIAGGAFHACAEDTTGADYCWGDNTSGDLGNNSTTQSNVPALAGPQAPANVRAVPLTRAARVSWTLPASLDGATLLGYQATARPGRAACATTGATRCIMTGLTRGIRYDVRVMAKTTAGNSGFSVPVTVTPLARPLAAAGRR